MIMSFISRDALKRIVGNSNRVGKLNEADDVFNRLGGVLKPDQSKSTNDIPKLVLDAMGVLDGKLQHITDPKTGKRARCDVGTATLIKQLWDSPEVDPDLKVKLFTTIPLQRIVKLLWSNSEFKK